MHSVMENGIEGIKMYQGSLFYSFYIVDNRRYLD